MKNLPAEYYIDPAIFLREQLDVFSTSWQLIGSAAHLQRSGDYVAADIAGTKVFVVRDQAGELRGFRNLCRHRGAKLLEEGSGHCRSIRCPYHNWVYRLDGSLERVPWFDETERLNLDEWPLHHITVGIWRNLVFACVAEKITLENQLGGLPEEIKNDPIEDYQWAGQKRMVFDANWKIYTDNFVEGYHIPGIHPDFFKAIDFEKFQTTTGANLVRMTAPVRDDLFYQGRWLWMWPNWTLSFFDGGMNTSRINPIGVARTELIYDFYFADTSEATRAARDAVIKSNIAVIEQDFDICAQVHQNYSSGGYQPGPLSPKHEQGVYQFQTSIKEALGKPEKP
ncbi:MAG: SRPBCC family protein [Arenicellales bacterium]|nr:SRPBCC family protein [Arenicellales bacterium]